ncbi:MAG: M3 family metallopeptidase [Planctomycetes bacterium]|nr:M3 family metallopeptidase [Planctomycetota bacterium]
MNETIRAYLDELDTTYARLHTAKEDLFWTTKMGLADDADAAQREFDAREIELQRFLKDPERLARTREVLALAEKPASDASESERVALRGWELTFRSHVIECAEGRALFEELVEDEGRLQRARGEFELGYRDAQGRTVRASSVKLSALLRSEPDAAVRRSAWDALASIEPFVLDHGFLDVVEKRNRLGRALGGEDFYDGTVRRVERMTKHEIFELLDELEARTREPARRSLDALVAKHGASVLEPWNFLYMTLGDTTKATDPYFPFAEALATWGRSFAGLGIRYEGATLVLDLVDRRGKYENGFMHGPEVGWRRRGERVPARIHFTANAIPGMVGSGQRALETLFHEGGHAAHFANIDMPAPCFGQEFAPTSVGFSETQSMFCDSLLGDADWRVRYARTRTGEPMPLGVIERALEASQPLAAWQARGMLAVCYGERAIYEMPREKRTKANVLAALRDVEKRILFLEHGAPRPILAVPHLLAGESSAYYHGYVLAEMAVHQTRDFFQKRDGHLVDNPAIGPDLARSYWREGNLRTFREFVKRLTGEELSARPLAEHANRTVDQARAEARAEVAKEPTLPRPPGAAGSNRPVELDARIKVIHGREVIAELTPGRFDEFARTFAAWIDRQTAA